MKPTIHRFLDTRRVTALAGLALMAVAVLLGPRLVHAQAAPLTNRIVGDAGGAVYSAQSIIRSKGSDTRVLPYGFFDYGRISARVDTLGIKTVPIGFGYLELSARISQDGWRADNAALAGLTDRKTPVPLGIGTFQQTPYGAFIVNAFLDANKSHGALVEATYAAELNAGRMSFYPQLGLEHRSAKYNNYLYGVTAAESIASGYAAFNAGASTIPVLGLAVDVLVTQSWMINLQLRRKWMDGSVTNSPLVNRRTLDTAYVALSYRFK